ncbi:molybdopterin-guanine dinucleotide biosynthesis protein B [Enterovibrio sp. ZSDZ35]|uniref:Molybdopterin-guanine dinucleotide biosynthesis protein B n=1 Tax=Enterovibrio qingdaonensis TaxID=2899818 RepID=A0ABT5QLS1_9GAMM|nr:molybdopterin-guanine dinucleotide biosynthesis protein B [Enterovibrio sp. ZSDZ35]MDD1781932.1 molybdopterin-guanine dinucleotide biosynthesis protein B [Enterovibrio sp. ZSDZ35]
MDSNKLTPVIGFAGFSGSGKTTLLEQVIPHLKAQGLRVGVLKHSHHTIEPDPPRKDSYRLRYAGSDQLLLATAKRHMLFFEYHDDGEEREPELTECLAQLDHLRLDVILVEGFRDATLTKIEVYRPSYEKPLLSQNDKNIIAIATDDTASIEKKVDDALTVLDLNQATQVSRFILHWLDHGEAEQKYRAFSNN